ncbi:MAG: hypothetical protein JXA77_15385 [Bacteroidales bacterium]|nr:hypothetical protein [Bacteroidales bacterium]MBN2820251.1 hypothetical protein [Bacteroidales bacterium]
MPQLNPDSDDLKKMKVFYDVTSILSIDKPLEKIISEVCNAIPVACKLPREVSVRIYINGVQFCSDFFNETPWIEQHKFRFPDNQEGLIEIYYSKKYITEAGNDALLRDEVFLNNIAILLSGFILKNKFRDLYHKNTERLKELKGISQTTEILKKGYKLEQLLQEICNFLPEAWQYPEQTVVRITYNNTVFLSSTEFNETPWFQKQTFETSDNKQGSIEVFYLKEFEQADEGPFLKEERSLLDNLAALISNSVSNKNLNELLSGNTERLKELRELNLTNTILHEHNDLDKSLQIICSNLPEAWQYSGDTAVRITYGKMVFVSREFKDTAWVQRQSFKISDKTTGLIEVFYLKEFPEADEGPFLKEERSLLVNLASLIEGSAIKTVFNKLLYENRERLKELKAINLTSAIIAEGKDIITTLQEICNILPKSWQYPKYTVTRIIFGNIICVSPNFSETNW